MFAGEDAHIPILKAPSNKTDSARRLKILLLRSWNWVRQAKQSAKEGCVPESVLPSSKAGWLDGFGAERVLLKFSQVFANERLARNCGPSRHWRSPCNRGLHECVSHDELRREASEGEGACSPLFAIRSHLPLRGKLGWMTPRVGVKTTLTTKRTLRGPRSQAGASFS